MSDDARSTGAGLQGDGPRELTFREHAVAFGKELFVVVIGAIVVASLLRGFVGQMFVIPSPSMENTLQIHDRVAVEKLSALHRGQVVVFEDPGGWLSDASAEPKPGAVARALEFVGVLPASETKYLIKRAVGLPGDEVVCCDTAGRITVNEQAIDESSYLRPDSTGNPTAPSAIDFDVVVPAGRIFVLGDNRDNSRDSRCHLNDEQVGAVKGENAFVSTDLVVGRAIAVVWPVDHHRRLPLPAAFDDLPVGVLPPAAPVITAGPEADC